MTGRRVFAKVGFNVEESWAARRELIDALIADGGPLRSLSPAAIRLGFMYWDRKWHRLRLTKSEASQAHLSRAIELNHFALRIWAGSGKSFNEFSDDDHWFGVSFHGDGTADLDTSEPEGRAELLTHLLMWAVENQRAVVGGAWGGGLPPWVDTPSRDWFRFFDSPLVPGPLWLLAVPEASHHLLAADAEAQSLAADVTLLRHGAVWRLVQQPADLSGEIVGRWAGVMDRLGLLPSNPPVRELVHSYLTHPHPTLSAQWP